jgi:isopentenyl-diphosphate delta-isomerase
VIDGIFARSEVDWAEPSRPAPPDPAAMDADRSVIPAIGDDGALFAVGKMEAHRRGILHQAVSVFVFSGDELLIQQRAAHKYHCGSLWANTCCTHPHWGEGVHDAAMRRVREELGFSVPLTAAREFTYRVAVTDGLVEHERVQVFRGVADKRRLRMDINPDEVQATLWVSPDALRRGASYGTKELAPWFRIYLQHWDQLGL